MPADLGQLVPQVSGLLEAATQTCSLSLALEPVGSGASLLHHLPTYLLTYPWSPNNPFLLFSGSLFPPSRQPQDPSADHGTGEQLCEGMTPPGRCPFKALPLFPGKCLKHSSLLPNWTQFLLYPQNLILNRVRHAKQSVTYNRAGSPLSFWRNDSEYLSCLE